MLQERAQELGRLIGQSDEYKAVKRTGEALNDDREAATAIGEVERLRREAQAMIQRGVNPTPEMEEQLDTLMERLQRNAAYQRAVAAQENYDKLMVRVNEWIAEGIRKGATSSIITLG